MKQQQLVIINTMLRLTAEESAILQTKQTVDLALAGYMLTTVLSKTLRPGTVAAAVMLTDTTSVLYS